MGRVRVRVQILVLVLARNLGPGLGGGRDRDRALGGVAACTMGPPLLKATLYLLCYAYYACTMGPSLRKVTRWNSHLRASIARAASAGLRSEGMPKAWRMEWG